MQYSAMGILSIIILLIINVDVFRAAGNDISPSKRHYRSFLFSVIFYHVTDIAWGLLDERHLIEALYADTVVYFAAMALSVLLWTMFTVRYLDRKTRFATVLTYTGKVFFAFQLAALAVNFFMPVFFFFDEGGAYREGVVRDVVLASQILMYLMTSLYTLSIAAKAKGSTRRRHFTIGLCGLTMVLAIAIQFFYPLLPLYSLGCLVSGCILHTFVLEDEKAEYIRALEESLAREERQKKELGKTKQMAYTDPLTGVKSMRAYVEAEAGMDWRIVQSQVSEFAVAVFDLNGLKKINDTLGHEAGDMWIVSASRLICNIFKHSPVFRIGGDEFMAILEGPDYVNRSDLMAAFDRQIEENLHQGQVVVSAGLAEFDPDQDDTYSAVFQRADERMYERKRFLKEHGSTLRD